MKHRPSKLKTLLLAVLFVATSIALNAQGLVDATDVPRTISYQGLLTSPDGMPFADGQYEITVTLYADGRGDNVVWQDSYLTSVSGGVFSVLLGSGSKALPSPDKLSTPLWIGTAFNGAPEMRPLTPMTASPYALNVPDQAITSNKLAAKAVTAEKVDMDYIAGVEIDGQQVTSKGTMLKLRSSDKIALTYDEVSQTVMIAEASRTTGKTGDRDKAPRTLGSPLAWDSNGDLTDGTLGGQATAVGDWIGTSSAAGNAIYNFDIRVRSTPVMSYHTAVIGTDPNIQGGQSSVVTALSVGSTIAGGAANNINGDYNAIGGGRINAIADGHYHVVSGGFLNNIYLGDFNTVGGGSNNNISAPGAGTFPINATIAGGEGNLIDGASQGGFIGGGSGNLITDNAEHGVVAGGAGNQITREYSTISGGQGNFIDDTSPFGTIGGGSTNIVASSGDYSTVGGGNNNALYNTYGTIAGGLDNTIDGTSTRGTISGGESNLISDNAQFSTIGGGGANTIRDQYGTISGGRNNSVDITSATATIGGGRDNTITNDGDYSTIGGGQENSVQGTHTTIPGGDKLSTAQSYAQVAVGFYNNPRGSMPTRPSAAQIAASNDPLFMVGNGDAGLAVGSNAFEVAYNGHTVVYGNLGNYPSPPVIEGATYADNVMYGWGEISGPGGVTSGFGIGTVGHVVGTGVYTISLNITDPTGTPLAMTNLAVTATLNDNSCAFINVVRNAFPANTFTVTIRDATCSPVDLAFTFHATGRR